MGSKHDLLRRKSIAKRFGQNTKRIDNELEKMSISDSCSLKVKEDYSAAQSKFFSYRASSQRPVQAGKVSPK